MNDLADAVHHNLVGSGADQIGFDSVFGFRKSPVDEGNLGDIVVGHWSEEGEGGIRDDGVDGSSPAGVGLVFKMGNQLMEACYH